MNCIEFFTGKGWKVTSPFGPRPDPFGGGGTDFHRGIDFGGYPVGEPVKTPTQGTITHAAYYTGWGNLVRVEDSKGFGHLFAHLSQMEKKGKKVKRGDVIGKNGKTGDATGPHVHYQINKPDGGIKGSGYWGDPADYIYWEEEKGMRKTYTVVKGDTLTKIANKFDVTVANLRKWNNRTPAQDRYLSIGTVLYVEGPKDNDVNDLLKRVEKLEKILEAIKKVL